MKSGGAATAFRVAAVIESIPGGAPDITIAVDPSRDFAKYVRLWRAGQVQLAFACAGSARSIGTHRRRVRRLAALVRQEIDAPGVAVYLRPAGGGQLRRGVSWSSASAMARAHRYLSQVVARVLNTALPLTVGDVGGTRGDIARDQELTFSFAIAAAPVIRNVSVVGAACIFADAPIATDDEALARFEAVAA